MKTRQAGFTLIEIVMAMVIISIALMGTIMTFKTAGKASADPMLIQQAISIGKSYMDEIYSKDFPSAFPCTTPPAGGRPDYASVCDYDGLSDTGARDQMNQALSGLSNYNVAVAINGTTATLGALTAGTEVVRIDVTVTHSQIPAVTLSGYRTAY